jgi:hypothetical protein
MATVRKQFTQRTPQSKWTLAGTLHNLRLVAEDIDPRLRIQAAEEIEGYTVSYPSSKAHAYISHKELEDGEWRRIRDRIRRIATL